MFASPGDLVPSPGYVYDGWTRAIGGQKAIFGNGDGAISMSVDGSHALSWRVRYSSALAAEDSATSTSYSVGPTTISADGAVGYFAVGNSVVGVAFATNGVVKTLNYPSPPKRIFALPSGKALVVITASSVYVSGL